MSKEEKEPIRSRRQLRQARSPAEAPGNGYPKVPILPAPGPQPSGSADQPGRSRRAADAPVDSPASGVRERSSQARARDRAALRTYRELSEPLTTTIPVLPSRRTLRQAQLDADRAPATRGNPVIPAGTEGSGRGNPRPGADTAVADSAMTVEAALAARQALVDDARDHVSGMGPEGAADPLAVDLEVLAKQRELAERAAILNQRAATRERLAQGSASNRPATNDPTTAHNLAMVTPLEFIRVPGVEQPVMRAPGTSHVPVITRSTPTSRPPKAPPLPKAPPPLPKAAPAAGNAPSSAPRVEETPSSGTRAASSAPHTAPTAAPTGESAPNTQRRSRAQTLKRAEAVHRSRSAQRRDQRTRTGAARQALPPAASTPASAARVSAQPVRVVEDGSDEVAPLPAGSAHGLDPLDAVTAGLGRAQRARLVQWGAVLLGAIALIIGLIMIINGLSH